ncbi:MAG: Asp-tRNA(Asn)/Glu-tRNA(Gln) amidotransferase subunit GatB, partial [Pseudomonadota bacterium]|nr:Asp-tRNA(Asn)/Glu-tRNA(Gln) amidotransferase subunit GatB [Pseudomonadota bacterium]
PDMRSASEAGSYMRKIHTLVQYLGISDGNMQEGSFRCDANVSVRPKNEDKLGVRTELKNLNSFRFVEKAIDFEVERQISVLEDNGQVVQETRLYDSEKNETRPMRGKEEANDYRYFPDPDLLPVFIDKNLIDQLRRELPELPDDKWERFVAEYKLSPSEASVLTSNQASADYFEVVVETSSGNAKTVLNWMTGSLAAALNREDLVIEKSKVAPIDLATLINRTEDGTLSSKLAKTVFEALWGGEGTTDEIIQKRQLQQITDSNAIESLVEKVIAAHPEQAKQFRDGKHKVLGFFVGQVMKACEGKANPEQVNNIVRSVLNAQ